jgi:phage terminase large subunit-like protein
MLPRGQGKTSLTAVLALYELLAGAEGAQVVVVVATDERQAGLTFRIAVRMVELNPALEQRCSSTTTI